ncbi:hypothetical protein, partial [Cupriavidus sp. SK-3]|uniref:hypothetical protein n=1 Tax=Cupriavidus sp. SK-3 TaxID=1470558 RepID=UPI001F41B604
MATTRHGASQPCPWPALMARRASGAALVPLLLGLWLALAGALLARPALAAPPGLAKLAAAVKADAAPA